MCSKSTKTRSPSLSITTVRDMLVVMTTGYRIATDYVAKSGSYG
jgi:hypothetical protein